jgi:hypothetical protein
VHAIWYHTLSATNERSTHTAGGTPASRAISRGLVSASSDVTAVCELDIVRVQGRRDTLDQRRHLFNESDQVVTMNPERRVLCNLVECIKRVPQTIASLGQPVHWPVKPVPSRRSPLHRIEAA